jgi:hypothetical protein
MEARLQQLVWTRTGVIPTPAHEQKFDCWPAEDHSLSPKRSFQMPQRPIDMRDPLRRIDAEDCRADIGRRC